MENITLKLDWDHPKLGLITAGTTINCTHEFAEEIREREKNIPVKSTDEEE